MRREQIMQTDFGNYVASPPLRTNHAGNLCQRLRAEQTDSLVYTRYARRVSVIDFG